MSDPQVQRDSPATSEGHWLSRSPLSSPWIWGGVLTYGFYRAIPHLPGQQELIQRYFCSHPLEYALAALFFVGMAVLGGKILTLWKERQGLEHPIPELPSEGGVEERCAVVRQALASWPPRLRQSWIGRRLGELTAYVQTRQTPEGVEEHARHLSATASDRLHESYALLQTITWAIPILGFLGTVMGITLAIANVDINQLETDGVVGGLSVAFDTTTVALSLSLVIVFATLFVRRAEDRILAEVEDLVFRRFVSMLPPRERHSPLHEAETEAARQLIDRTETLITQQTELWRESVDALRTRWTETLQTHQQELSSSLSSGVEGTLQNHAEQLQSLRQEFVQAYETVTRSLTDQLDASQSVHRDQQQALQQQMVELWSQIRQEMLSERDAQQQQSQAWLDQFAQTIERYTQGLQETAVLVERQLQEISDQTALLSKVVDQEEQLAGLQKRLTENLEALRAAETMEETLHSLNAAIHLLTARTRPHAA